MKVEKTAKTLRLLSSEILETLAFGLVYSNSLIVLKIMLGLPPGLRQTKSIWPAFASVMFILVKSRLIGISQAKKSKTTISAYHSCSLFWFLLRWISEKSLVVKAVISFLSVKTFLLSSGFYIFLLKQINSPASCLWTPVIAINYRLGFPLINFFPFPRD